MKRLLAILLIATPTSALEPTARMFDASMGAPVSSAEDIARNVTFPYVYVKACWADTEDEAEVLAYTTPGAGFVGHLPKPKPGERFLLEIRTNMPIDQPFTRILRIYSDGTEEVVPVERAK